MELLIEWYLFKGTIVNGMGFENYIDIIEYKIKIVE